MKQNSFRFRVAIRHLSFGHLSTVFARYRSVSITNLEMDHDLLLLVPVIPQVDLNSALATCHHKSLPLEDS
jgi:hypothetical protein